MCLRGFWVEWDTLFFSEFFFSAQSPKEKNFQVALQGQLELVNEKHFIAMNYDKKNLTWKYWITHHNEYYDEKNQDLNEIKRNLVTDLECCNDWKAFVW